MVHEGQLQLRQGLAGSGPAPREVAHREPGQQPTVLRHHPAAQNPRKPLPDLTIPVAVLHYTSMLDILSHTHAGAMGSTWPCTPPEPILDYNMVVIFLLAVGTVAVGGYWSRRD